MGPRNSAKTSTIFFPLNQATGDTSLASQQTNRSRRGVLVAFLFHLFEELEQEVKRAFKPGDIVAKVSCSCVECFHEELIDMFRVPPHRAGEKRPSVVKNAQTG